MLKTSQNYQNGAELIQECVAQCKWCQGTGLEKRHHAPADRQAWMKDYGLRPLVEGKAGFNQNILMTSSISMITWSSRP